MKKGCLSDYFTEIAVKKLSVVDVDPRKSNQHELGGIKGIFPKKKIIDNILFIYFGEDENETISEDVPITWYDTRKNDPDRSPEWRLYYRTNSVVNKAEAGDMLFMCKRTDGRVIAIITQAQSTIENQLCWIFGLKDVEDKFAEKNIKEDNKNIEFVSGYILDVIGIETEEEDERYLEKLLIAFPGGFPTTKVFSQFARDSVGDISSLDGPDKTIMAWMEHEEMLFKTYEKYLVSDHIKKGFDDVDEFIAFSLSVHNRRKSRVGYAFENHLEYLFMKHEIKYSRNKTTEGNSKPDFIFPGIKQYHDEAFSSAKLFMLGVKTTCKDRWRQVLAEAQRIEVKHLATLEPGISKNQTDEMNSQKVRLVLPEPIHATYKDEQQKWLLNIGEFMKLINVEKVL